MADLVIKTAEELRDSDVEARSAGRRAARETPLLRAVLRLFAGTGGPVSVAAVLASVPGARPAEVGKMLVVLSDDDLLVLRDHSIELAYPFSTSPNTLRRPSIRWPGALHLLRDRCTGDRADAERARRDHHAVPSLRRVVAVRGEPRRAIA